MRCFSPLRTPGVSTRVTSFSRGEGHCASSSRPKKPFPYCAKPCNYNFTLLFWLSTWTLRTLDVACVFVFRANSTEGRSKCRLTVQGSANMPSCYSVRLGSWAACDCLPLCIKSTCTTASRLWSTCVGQHRSEGSPSNTLRAGITWKGLSGLTMRVLPGVRRSSMPSITTTKRSVVGSGPMLIPGYSRPSKCLMNVVLPVI